MNEPTEKSPTENTQPTSPLEGFCLGLLAITDSTKRTELFNEYVATILRNDHNAVFWGDRLLTLDKSAGFLKEARFADALNQIIGNHIYDQYSGPQSVAWRLHTLAWAAKEALKLDGDFVECGTFKGDFAWMLTRCVDYPQKNKRFFLYDSFEGLSDELVREDDYKFNPNYKDIANKSYREPGIYESVVNRFSSNASVTITKGFLPGTLNECCPKKISFLHMDLNSPEAERQTLEKLWDRIVEGGFIVFDDYGWVFFERQKEVEDEWAKNLQHSILELPSGQGLLIKRTARHPLRDRLSSLLPG